MGGGGGAQRPVWYGNELIKTGARSARARTRGQNTLVNWILWLRIMAYHDNLVFDWLKIQEYDHILIRAWGIFYWYGMV
jgi:hypothetical protein